MTVPAYSLWPEDITGDTLSPTLILEEQAQAITAQTNRILVGNVKSGGVEDKRRVINLDLVVPALNSSSYRILTAYHANERAYPAWIDSSALQPNMSLGALFEMSSLSSLATKLSGQAQPKAPNEASSDAEFRALLGKVLSSSEVKSLAVSLVALARERMKEREQKDSDDADRVTTAPEVEKSI